MSNTQKVIKYLALALAVAIILTIFSSIGKALSLISLIGDKSVADDKTAVYDKVTALSVELSSADLTINTARDFDIEYDKSRVSVKINGDTLTIKEKKRGIFNIKRTAEVIVTVPQDTVFESAEIESGAGKITVNGISADELSLELGAGNVELKKLDISQSADIDGGAGNIKIADSTVNSLDLDMGVGKLGLEAYITGNSEIDFGIGKATLTLLGEAEDYRLRMDKGIGAVSFNGEDMKNGTYYGNGQNSLDMSGGIGEITIVTEQ